MEGLAGMASRDLAADFLHLAISWYGLSIYSSLIQKLVMPLLDIGNILYNLPV